MSDLESTRPGWFLRAFGISWILVAVGLAIWDLAIPRTHWFVLLNIITLVAGVWNFHLGTAQIRRAREHHEFMEAHRALLDAPRWTP